MDCAGFMSIWVSTLCVEIYSFVGGLLVDRSYVVAVIGIDGDVEKVDSISCGGFVCKV